MTDTERLNLIEHYNWIIAKIEDNWIITGSYGYVEGNSLREAIDATLAAQIKWSLG